MQDALRIVQELDLSLRRIQLDLAVIYASPEDAGAKLGPWPDLADGLEELTYQNLVTYKGPGQPMRLATMLELAGFLVDYAKLEFRGDWDPLKQPNAEQAANDESEESEEASQARDKFVNDFVYGERSGVYAVSTHRPEWLQPDAKAWQEQLKPGVYEVTGFELPIRLIVPREVALIPRNALWHLLSGVPERIEYGLKHCELKDRVMFGIFQDQLNRSYCEGGIPMPITVEDYRREFFERVLSEATPEQLASAIAMLSPEQRLSGLSPEDRLSGLLPEDRLDGLSPEEIQTAMEKLGQEPAQKSKKKAKTGKKKAKRGKSGSG